MSEHPSHLSDSLDDRFRAGKRESITRLSDNVFAIAATLAVFAIGPDFASLRSGAIVYAVSFLIIAVFWWGHRDLRIRLDAVDAPFTIIILALLFAVAAIPVAGRMLYTHPSTDAARVYAATMIVAGLLNMTQWLYVALRGGRLLHSDVPLHYAWTRVATTATLPVAFGAMLAFPAQVPPAAAPILVLVIVAIRRTVQIVRE